MPSTYSGTPDGHWYSSGRVSIVCESKSNGKSGTSSCPPRHLPGGDKTFKTIRRIIGGPNHRNPTEGIRGVRGNNSERVLKCPPQGEIEKAGSVRILIIIQKESLRGLFDCQNNSPASGRYEFAAIVIDHSGIPVYIDPMVSKKPVPPGQVHRRIVAIQNPGPALPRRRVSGLVPGRVLQKSILQKTHRGKGR